MRSDFKTSAKKVCVDFVFHRRMIQHDFSSTLLLLQPLLRSPLCRFTMFFAVSFLLNMGFKREKLERISWDCYHCWIVLFFYFLFVFAVNLGDLSGRSGFLESQTIFSRFMTKLPHARSDVSEIFCSDCSSSKPLLACFMCLTFCLAHFFSFALLSVRPESLLIISRKENQREIGKHKKQFALNKL